VLFLFIASIQLLVAAAPSESLHFSSNPSVAEISRARVFEEPLVPIGGTPGQEESLELAAALSSYADRNGPDDFGALTQFLNKHPKSHWNASLLTGLGLEYYNTAHYSLALDAWKQAWAHASEPRQLPELLVMNRAAAELAGLYSRLGRMDELEAHLKSVEGRFFLDTSAQKINSARDGLWMMKNRPEVSFRCGALA